LRIIRTVLNARIFFLICFRGRLGGDIWHDSLGGMTYNELREELNSKFGTEGWWFDCPEMPDIQVWAHDSDVGQTIVGEGKSVMLAMKDAIS
jgi:hypothetical protein